jgi:hypothetical protein
MDRSRCGDGARGRCRRASSLERGATVQIKRSQCFYPSRPLTLVFPVTRFTRRSSARPTFKRDGVLRSDLRFKAIGPACIFGLGALVVKARRERSFRVYVDVRSALPWRGEVLLPGRRPGAPPRRPPASRTRPFRSMISARCTSTTRWCPTSASRGCRRSSSTTAARPASGCRRRLSTATLYELTREGITNTCSTACGTAASSPTG